MYAWELLPRLVHTKLVGQKDGELTFTGTPDEWKRVEWMEFALLWIHN